MDDLVRISTVLEKAHQEGRNSLLEPEVYEIFKFLGLNIPVFLHFADLKFSAADMAQKVIQQIKSARVVLKLVSHKNIHKTDSGGVIITENKQKSVEEGINKLKSKFSDISGIMASQFIEHSAFSLGEEIMIGSRADEAFGPLITFSPGGTNAEDIANSLKNHIAIDIIPANFVNNRKDWENFLAGSWTWRYVAGKVRGGRKLAEEEEMIRWFEAFSHVMKRFSKGTDSDWEILELEANPLAVSKGKIIALDGVLRFRKSERSFRKKPSLDGVKSLLEPENVAIVGVSEKKMNMARIILKNVIKAGFDKNRLYIVKDYDGEIEGIKCYKHISDISRKIDMYVVAVPSQAVADVLKEAAESGKVNGVVLISGGMGEKSGSETLAKEVRQIILQGREKNPDFVLSGGNSLGIVLQKSKVNTLFIPKYKMAYPLEGNPNIARTAFVSQSGAFVISVLSKMPWLRPLYSITVGNQQDITVTDYVESLVEENDIEVVLIYIEGFKNEDGIRLAKIIQKGTAKGKKIILYKAGRTVVGQKAVMGHTASLAGDYVTAKKIMEKAGAMVADTFDDFSDLTLITCHLAKYEIPNGKVFIMSNAGFETAGMADSLEGSISVEIGENDLKKRIEEIFKKHNLQDIVDFKNPLDVTPMATDRAVGEILSEIMNYSDARAAIVSMVPLTAALNTLPKSEKYPDDIEKSFLKKAAEESKRTRKPVIFCVACGALYDPYVKYAMDLGIPTFRSADRAVRIYSRYLNYLKQFSKPR